MYPHCSGHFLTISQPRRSYLQHAGSRTSRACLQLGHSMFNVMPSGPVFGIPCCSACSIFFHILPKIIQVFIYPFYCFSQLCNHFSSVHTFITVAGNHLEVYASWIIRLFVANFLPQKPNYYCERKYKLHYDSDYVFIHFSALLEKNFFRRQPLPFLPKFPPFTFIMKTAKSLNQSQFSRSHHFTSPHFSTIYTALPLSHYYHRAPSSQEGRGCGVTK